MTRKEPARITDCLKEISRTEVFILVLLNKEEEKVPRSIRKEGYRKVKKSKNQKRPLEVHSFSRKMKAVEHLSVEEPVFLMENFENPS